MRDNDKEFATLQNPEEWDIERAERRPGVKNARAIVSVAFAREDFDRLSEWARKLKRRTSEFIREAAIEKINRYEMSTTVTNYSGSKGSVLITPTLPSETRFSGSAAQLKEEAVTA